jgi:hypothetical protein
MIGACLQVGFREKSTAVVVIVMIGLVRYLPKRAKISAGHARVKFGCESRDKSLPRV